MCGAIPVVEKPCDCYDGYTYFLMSDDLRDADWSSEIAIFNAAMARERLAIDRSLLVPEVGRLLSLNVVTAHK